MHIEMLEQEEMYADNPRGSGFAITHNHIYILLHHSNNV